MTKPFTEEDFSMQITEDRNWRMKEISDLKVAIKRSDASLRKVLLRALVTICYAHWEGYVRFAARKYLEHVALKRCKYAELDAQFLRNYFLPRLAALSSSKTRISDLCVLIDDILNSSDRRFSHVNKNLVNTKANLSYEVLEDICLVCGIHTYKLYNLSGFINLVLLRRRNSIAHGEDTFIHIDDLDEITNKTIELMRIFGNALENQVVLKSYKSAQSSYVSSSGSHQTVNVCT